MRNYNLPASVERFGQRLIRRFEFSLDQHRFSIKMPSRVFRILDVGAVLVELTGPVVGYLYALVCEGDDCVDQHFSIEKSDELIDDVSMSYDYAGDLCNGRFLFWSPK